MGNLSANFSDYEFASPDGWVGPSVDQRLLTLLERIRAHERICDRVVTVSKGGGIRSPEYNRRIRRCGRRNGTEGVPHGNFHGLTCPVCGGTGYQRSAKRSRHMKGTEADITIRGVSPDVVADVAEELGARNIGRYNTFTHVGVGGDPSRKARWDMRS